MIWNPDQYLKYSNERLRPALDLMARIAIKEPRTIVDLGCGAGNVTKLIAERWPSAHVIGVDNSPSMLANARASTAGEAAYEWIEADVANWKPSEAVEIIYSNAALHWRDDHATLFSAIFDWLAPGGAFAVQMPDQSQQPSHVAIADVVSSSRWRDRLGPLLRPSPVAPMAAYFKWLDGAAQQVDAWTTEYLHVLAASADEHPVVTWTKGTALTPYLAVLEEDAQRDFIRDYEIRIRKAYPPLADGRVLLTYRRVFFVALRKGDW